MLLLYSNTAGADESRAREAGHTRAAGSAWGRCLLSLAWARYDSGPMPEIACPERGRPYFPARPALHFSISHTRGLVLCAFGEQEVGADVEGAREVSPALRRRVLSPEEAAQFDFFEVWTLRESYYKLSGQGGPSSPRFRREGGRVLCEDERAVCVLTKLGGYDAALCTWEPAGFMVEEVPVEALMR